MTDIIIGIMGALMGVIALWVAVVGVIFCIMYVKDPETALRILDSFFGYIPGDEEDENGNENENKNQNNEQDTWHQ